MLCVLDAKDEVLSFFKIYKNEVKLQGGCKLQRPRIDKGGGYYDPTYFQSMGIIYETTVRYTPQSNGVAERKSRSLQEMVNFMLSYSSLSEGFWAEAMLTACHILNRIPTRTNKHTPYEL